MIDLQNVPVLVASLADIIRSKKAARRPRDLAVLDILERALEEGSGKKAEAGRRRPRK